MIYIRERGNFMVYIIIYKMLNFVAQIYSSTLYSKSTLKSFQETLHKHKVHENENKIVEALEAHLIDSKENAEKNSSLDEKKSLFKNWPLMSSIIMYCVFGFHDMAYTEVYFYLFLFLMGLKIILNVMSINYVFSKNVLDLKI